RTADPHPEPHDPGHGPLPEPSAAVTDADGRLIAAPGLELHLADGLTVRVVEVADKHVVAALTAPDTGRDSDDGHELVELPFGMVVTTDDRRGALAPPPRRPGTAGASAASSV